MDFCGNLRHALCWAFLKAILKVYFLSCVLHLPHTMTFVALSLRQYWISTSFCASFTSSIPWQHSSFKINYFTSNLLCYGNFDTIVDVEAIVTWKKYIDNFGITEVDLLTSSTKIVKIGSCKIITKMHCFGRSESSRSSDIDFKRLGFLKIQDWPIYLWSYLLECWNELGVFQRQTKMFLFSLIAIVL